MERRARVEGVELAWETHGEGTPVLFVHGFPFDRWIWRAQLAEAALGRRIAPDLRGFGASQLGPAPVSMATYASDLAALLDVLGIPSAVVCGLSMGGYVALEFVHRFPARVRGLILMDTRAEAETAEGRRGRDELVAAVRAAGPRALVERLLPRLLAERTVRTAPHVVEELREMMLRAPAAGVVAALRAMRDRSDHTATLARLTVPTLVVAGTEDSITPPAVARGLVETVPGARLALVRDAAHLPALEQPEATNRHLGAFLRALG